MFGNLVSICVRLYKSKLYFDKLLGGLSSPLLFPAESSQEDSLSKFPNQGYFNPHTTKWPWFQIEGTLEKFAILERNETV